VINLSGGKIIRKLYLYDDNSSYQQRNVDGSYKTQKADMAAALMYIKTLSLDQNTSPNGHLTLDNGESTASIRIFIEQPDYIAGLFGKKRIYGLPMVEESSGLLYRLPMSDGSGVYEGAHFIYFINKRQLFLERSQYVPRKSIFQDLILSKLKNHNSIQIDDVFFKPVVRDSLDSFLARYGDATEIEVDVDQNFISDIKDYNGKLGSLLEGLKDILPEGEQIKFGSGIAKYQKVGGMSKAKNFIVDLIRNVPEAVTKARAKVKVESDQQGRAIDFNLLSEEAGYPVVIPIDENRVVDSNEMWGTMLDVYERIQNGINVREENEEAS
jgi:hypothetical protein